MFFLRRPNRDSIAAFLAEQRTHDFSYSEVGATAHHPPRGYLVDRHRVKVGAGARAFSDASACLRAWRMFRLGWLELVEAGTSIEAGSTVAVLVRHLGFWSLNACRIAYVIDEPRHHGFAYGTLRDHAEQGEERFSARWADDNSVWYEILAFSRPRQWQARAARPLARRLQKRFARDSMAAMVRCVGERGLAK